MADRKTVKPSEMNDHWTLDLERLGMKGTGDELVRLVLQCQPPYAVGVHGKWGSGKTSLMRYAMAALGGHPLALSLSTSEQPHGELPDDLADAWKALREARDECRAQHCGTTEMVVVPIWFNPWQHQNADQPLVALLHELRAQFTLRARIASKSGKIAAVGIEAGLNLLGRLAGFAAALGGAPQAGSALARGPGVAEVVRSAAERYEQQNFEVLEVAQRLNMMFEQAVDRLLTEEVDGQDAGNGAETKARRLVIFIDDLDRCSDTNAVRLLEAIKLYLQTRNCVFVVGMDGTATRRAIERVLDHRGNDAQEYLEKLFQATLHVPVPSGYEAFVAGLLEQLEFGMDECGMNPAELVQTITRLVEPNPRKIKNFVNSLAVAWRLAAGKVEIQPFLLVAYLRHYHPEVHRLLAYDPKNADDLHKALTEGLIQVSASASPVYRLFHWSFRHAFPTVGSDGVDRTDGPGRTLVVDELLARLDRHRGDAAFVELWKSGVFATDPPRVVERLTPALRVRVELAGGPK
jgi:KAP family P-loop domain